MSRRDEILILQEDLKRASSKKGVRWAMLIDLRRCTGCRSCVAGCVAENKNPPGIMYRPVYEQEDGTFPRVKRYFVPRPCQQCDKPPCVEACPRKGKATWKGDGGIVMVDYKSCIGCGKCVIACPYKARALDGGAFYTESTPKLQSYETLPAFEYGKAWPRNRDHVPIGTARKCHFCVHRLRKGVLPACVSTCPCRANFFGDPEDKKGLLSMYMKENKIKVLKEVKSYEREPLGPTDLRGKDPFSLSSAVGYPGLIPVFSDVSSTEPRVFYILP
jgi:molybdopterin-containing oxidoreductase family iron-sulfur binding subunit